MNGKNKDYLKNVYNLNNYYDLKFEKGLKDDEYLKIIRTSKI